MPGAPKNSSVVKKRKSDSKDDGRSTSKRRAVPDTNAALQKCIETLENEVAESRKHLNNVATLVTLFKGDGEAERFNAAAAVSLCRVFSRLMAAGSLSGFTKASDQEKVVIQWLAGKYTEYKQTLVTMISEGSADIHGLALDLAMRLLKEESTHLSQNQGDEQKWKGGVFREMLPAVLFTKGADEVRTKFCAEYFSKFDDVRYFTYMIISELSSSYDAEKIDFVISVLSSIETVPSTADELENWYLGQPKKTRKTPVLSIHSHKRRAQEAWLTILNSSDLTLAHRKTLLNIATRSIVPWFINPELLMDFLTASCDAGGSLSLLALSGLFHLISVKNLDYPNFYPKLYSLLDNDLLHSKHRSAFFRHLNIFLGSSHLPATLIASFIKRLSRLALQAPPAAIIAIVPYLYNLFKAHPATTHMLHRPVPKDATDEDGWGIDPFDPKEQDPTLTDAISSSLWEIETLQSHWHPNVASLCRIISEQFTKQQYTMDDFLDYSYRGMIDAELARDKPEGEEESNTRRPKRIREVVVEYQIPKRIFTKPTEEGEKDERGLLGEIFAF